MSRSAKHAGFTLMELVLVLVVIAICAAISAPNLRGFAHNRLLPNAATSLVTTARWCRVQAICQGVEFRLNLDKPSGKWWVTKADDTGLTFNDVTSDMGAEYTLPEGLIIQQIVYQGEIEASEEGDFISFLPNGLCDPAIITLASESLSTRIGTEGPTIPYHILPEARR